MAQAQDLLDFGRHCEFRREFAAPLFTDLPCSRNPAVAYLSGGVLLLPVAAASFVERWRQPERQTRARRWPTAAAQRWQRLSWPTSSLRAAAWERTTSACPSRKGGCVLL